jgi:serine/threonine-protein kinase HipA
MTADVMYAGRKVGVVFWDDARRTGVFQQRWTLSPAFDVTYAHNPEPGKWTATQQMSVLGKREGITVDDLIEVGRHCTIATRPKVKAVVDEVVSALEQWPALADQADVSEDVSSKINRVITGQIDLT